MENNLRAYRQAAGLSQQAVADLFKNRYGKSTVSYQQVSNWERGTPPSLENALILSKIYNCTVNDLFKLE